METLCHWQGRDCHEATLTPRSHLVQHGADQKRFQEDLEVFRRNRAFKVMYDAFDHFHVGFEKVAEEILARRTV